MLFSRKKGPGTHSQFVLHIHPKYTKIH